MSRVRYDDGVSSIAPSTPCCLGSGPSEATRLVAHARGQEAAEPALAVGQAERCEPRAGEVARAVDESLQDLVDRQAGCDREHGIADRLQRRAEPFFHSMRR